jgi:ligand-binding sensor domain-containing protein
VTGLAGSYVHALAVAPDGAVWFGGWGQGLSRFDGQRCQTYSTADGLASDNTSAVAVAPDGTVWVATDAGFSRLAGGNWTTNLSTPGDLCPEPSYGGMAVTPDGALWLSSSRGLLRFDGQTWSTYPDPPLVESCEEITSIAVAPDGAIWVGSQQHGAGRFDGTEWTTYTEADGLPEKGAGAIAVAPDGTVWFFSSNFLTRYVPPAGP